MKIFVVDQGLYEDNEIILVTTDFDEALNLVLFYSKRFNGHIAIWEDSEELYAYGSLNAELINNKRSFTYDELKNDIIKFSGIKL